MQLLLAVALTTVTAIAQIPHAQLVFAHRNVSPTVAAIQILDPDTGVVTPLLPQSGSLATHGSRTVAVDPAAPNTLYSTTTLSVSIAATVTVLNLTGNTFTRSSINVNLGGAGLPFHLRWAPGFGLLILGRGGQINRMYLRDANGTVTTQPTATMLPNNASDMVFLNGRAYASSEGDASATAFGTIVEWDLAANTDRVLGASYPPISSLSLFGGQLLAGDINGDLHLIDPITGTSTAFLPTGLGKLTSLAVDPLSRVFVLAENPGAWSIHNVFVPGAPLYTSTLAIEDLEIGTALAPTLLTFGSGCPGSNAMTPVFTYGSMPAIGTTFTVQLAGAPPSTAAILVLGSSRVADPGGPLPRDLGPLGMNGCTQYVNALVAAFAATSPGGTGSLGLPIPNNPALGGLRIPMQWVAVDPPANAFGATTSNGAEAYLR